MQVRRYVPWTPLRLVVAAVCLEALVTLMPPLPSPEVRLASSLSPEGAAVRRPPHWLVKVDGWTFEMDRVHRGYLRDLEGASAEIEDSQLPWEEKGNEIPYLDLIARTSAAERIDWRLVVALIAVESAFDATSESEAGAYGLMQVRPIAAREVEMAEFHTPAANVRAGVRYLRRLLSMFPAADRYQQLALALAAYNMGPAHLNDAQLLATRYGLNPRRWYDGLELMLPLLEQPGIYRTLPNGFARGRETVRYVEQVLTRYERLRRQYVIARDQETQVN